MEEKNEPTQGNYGATLHGTNSIKTTNKKST